MSHIQRKRLLVNTVPYNSKVAKHPKLFEIAMDGRYCKLNFLEERITKVTITYFPLETK